MSSAADRLAQEEAKLAKLKADWDAMHARSDRVTPGGLHGDPGTLSGVTRRRKGVDQARWDAYEGEAAAFRAVRAQERVVTACRGVVRVEVDRAAHVWTVEELSCARFVRTSAGWWRVVRVNVKSVSVESGFSWVERLSLGSIIEVKS